MLKNPCGVGYARGPVVITSGLQLHKEMPTTTHPCISKLSPLQEPGSQQQTEPWPRSKAQKGTHTDGLRTEGSVRTAQTCSLTAEGLRTTRQLLQEALAGLWQARPEGHGRPAAAEASSAHLIVACACLAACRKRPHLRPHPTEGRSTGPSVPGLLVNPLASQPLGALGPSRVWPPGCGRACPSCSGVLSEGVGGVRWLPQRARGPRTANNPHRPVTFHSVRGSESDASHPTGAQWGPEPSRTTTARANCLVKTSVSANRLCPCHSQAQPAVLCQEPQSHPVTNSS